VAHLDHLELREQVEHPDKQARWEVQVLKEPRGALALLVPLVVQVPLVVLAPREGLVPPVSRVSLEKVAQPEALEPTGLQGQSVAQEPWDQLEWQGHRDRLVLWVRLEQQGQVVDQVLKGQMVRKVRLDQLEGLVTRGQLVKSELVEPLVHLEHLEVLELAVLLEPQDQQVDLELVERQES